MILASSVLAAGVALSEGPRPLGGILDFSLGATVWTVIAFFLALPVMWKFVYGPITKALEERDKKVEDAILAADVARKEAEASMAEARAALEKAQAEARRMVDEAVARAERQAAEAARAADERAQAALQKARDAIAAEKRQALLEIRAEAVALTIAATGKLLQQNVDAPQNRRLVEGFLQGAGRS
ncbi:MAG: F0F1 ATP synthase subunit B [Planctomycetes bacterium]|nr:F0F1 ATP synthase subunit B [Planctomycetota bacterium]